MKGTRRGRGGWKEERIIQLCTCTCNVHVHLCRPLQMYDPWRMDAMPCLSPSLSPVQQHFVDTLLQVKGLMTDNLAVLQLEWLQHDSFTNRKCQSQHFSMSNAGGIGVEKAMQGMEEGGGGSGCGEKRMKSGRVYTINK